jgi:hypothetical protein
MSEEFLQTFDGGGEPTVPHQNSFHSVVNIAL